MTDRELMELAARAADYCLTDGSQGYRTFRCKGGVEWNPLESDGDAFRLMVKLGITKTLDLELGPGGALVTIHHPEVYADEYNEPKQPEFDAVAATRRAIVRAAAEIARAQAA